MAPTGTTGLRYQDFINEMLLCFGFCTINKGGRSEAKRSDNLKHFNAEFLSLFKGAFTYDVRCFEGIFDLPTYPNQTLYYISLFSKIR